MTILVESYIILVLRMRKERDFMKVVNHPDFNPIVYLTEQNNKPVFEYYYNTKFDKFGNRDDWFNKDNYEMVVVDASLSAQEIDELFNDHYGDTIYPI